MVARVAHSSLSGLTIAVMIGTTLGIGNFWLFTIAAGRLERSLRPLSAKAQERILGGIYMAAFLWAFIAEILGNKLTTSVLYSLR